MLRRPILYGMDFSPPVRTVLLTAKYLGLDLENRLVRDIQLFITILMSHIVFFFTERSTFLNKSSYPKTISRYYYWRYNYISY